MLTAKVLAGVIALIREGTDVTQEIVTTEEIIFATLNLESALANRDATKTMYS